MVSTTFLIRGIELVEALRLRVARFSIGIALLFGVDGCHRGVGVATATPKWTALVDVTTIPDSDGPPLRHRVILMHGTRIARVGPRDSVSIPANAVVYRLSGTTALPGFWNSHVHFIEPRYQGADTMRATRASAQLREMFTRYGFVHVFETSSLTHNTLSLRARIRSGEVVGPDVKTTLEGFVPAGGSPRYLRVALPVIADSSAARDSVRARVRDGADGIKLFTVPITRTQPFPVMQLSIVRAVADEAHRHHLPLFAHPTNLDGVEVAVAGGVDILAHSAPMAGIFTDSLLRSMLQRHVALTPTLALWEDDYGPDTAGMGAFVRSGEAQVREYAQLGGDILFGTDVGYVQHPNPAREYELMREAGLSAREIIRSLTSTPARRFQDVSHTGYLRPGYDADIVVVRGDPDLDIHALADVTLTFKRGRALFAAASMR
jgi:imidazolonepropionase-like amidohydrolase